MGQDKDTGTLVIKTHISEDDQMSSHQNATLHSAIEGIAVSIATYPHYPPILSTQESVKGYLAAKLAPLVLGGWSFDIQMGASSEGDSKLDGKMDVSTEDIQECNIAMANDTYRAVAMSTGHLHPSDFDCLRQNAFRMNIVMARDTGFFIKLSEMDEYDPRKYEDWQEILPGISHSLFILLSSAYVNGFRMVEFDSDGEVFEAFEVFEDEPVSA